MIDKLGNGFSLEINEDVILSRSDHSKIMNFLYIITNCEKKNKPKPLFTCTCSIYAHKEAHWNSTVSSSVFTQLVSSCPVVEIRNLLLQLDQNAALCGAIVSSVSCQIPNCLHCETFIVSWIRCVQCWWVVRETIVWPKSVRQFIACGNAVSKIKAWNLQSRWFSF